MQEKFRAKGKKLYFGFVHLQKAFDRVLREVIRWAMHKLGVEEWLVSAVMSLYTGAKTVVRTVYGNSNGFEVKVGMHQGSTLSPLLFVIVMEALSREFRVALPWELLYADDLAVIAETEDDLIKSLNEWMDFVENRGMRVNMNKTKVILVRNGRRLRWPCDVCGRGVGNNSIECTSCQKWVHRKCSAGAYNSGKPGNLREFVNAGKLRGNLNFTLGIYQMLAVFFMTQSEIHKKIT